MHISKIVLAVLVGAATASSDLAKLNSTESGAVLTGVGPVITETTVTEPLAIMPTRITRYKWLFLPIPLVRVLPTFSTPIQWTRPNGTLTSSTTNTTADFLAPSGRFLRVPIYRSTNQSSSTPTSGTAVPQANTTSQAPKITESVESVLQNNIARWVSDLDTTASIQTITPTWTVSYRKFHGPYLVPQATTAVSDPVKEESVGARAAPTVTASTFRA